MGTTEKFEMRTCAELLPTPALAAKWLQILNEKRNEISPDRRERQFLVGHGWLMCLHDANLLPPGDLADLRELLIQAKPRELDHLPVKSSSQ